MVSRGLSICLFAFWLCPVAALSAEQPDSVDQESLAEHVDHRVAPVYPPIAKAAHIQGTVLFELRIGADGKIESMKVVSVRQSSSTSFVVFGR